MMKDERWRMKDERWRNAWFLAVWGILVMDRQTDICDCKVAFAIENNAHYQIYPVLNCLMKNTQETERSQTNLSFWQEDPWCHFFQFTKYRCMILQYFRFYRILMEKSQILFEDFWDRISTPELLPYFCWDTL